MLLTISIVKMICEIALMALLGKGLLFVLAGQQREQNVFYRLLNILSQPFEVIVRKITPRFILDSHIPVATFSTLACLWMFSVMMKVEICINASMVGCR